MSVPSLNGESTVSYHICLILEIYTYMDIDEIMSQVRQHPKPCV